MSSPDLLPAERLAPFYALAATAHHYTAVSAFYALVDEDVKKGDFGALGGLLAALDLSRLDPFFLCSITRYIHTLAERLDGWSDYLAAVSDALSAHGLDPERALRGVNGR